MRITTNNKGVRAKFVVGLSGQAKRYVLVWRSGNASPSIAWSSTIALMDTNGLLWRGRGVFYVMFLRAVFFGFASRFRQARQETVKAYHYRNVMRVNGYGSRYGVIGMVFHRSNQVTTSVATLIVRRNDFFSAKVRVQLAFWGLMSRYQILFSFYGLLVNRESQLVWGVKEGRRFSSVIRRSNGHGGIRVIAFGARPTTSRS